MVKIRKPSLREIELADTPEQLQKLYEKYNMRQECDICSKKGALEVDLWYCEQCGKFYCLSCVKKDGVLSAYETTYLRCPKEGHRMGKF